MGFLEVDPTSIDVNLIYLGLVISLWIAVTAAYVPGTGILEGIALVGLFAAIAILIQMSISWFAVLLIAVGISAFIVMPFINVRYAPIAIIGLILQGFGGFFLFPGTQEIARVSPLILGITIILPWGYHQFILMPMLKNMKTRPVEDKDRNLIGMIGRVTKTIDPIGTVYVNSEHWSATNEDDIVIPEGEKVVVVGRQELKLIVEPYKRKRTQPAEFEEIEER
ncbi:MAG: hypothetical protein D6711_03550 [Chloroflexi bacterium]|nr:MAG: hypothetical protein D6711_03550 [Chloroflexota bacterium]